MCPARKVYERSKKWSAASDQLEDVLEFGVK